MGEAKRKRETGALAPAWQHERLILGHRSGLFARKQGRLVMKVFEVISDRADVHSIERAMRALEAAGLSIFDFTLTDTEADFEMTSEHLLWKLWSRDDEALDRLIEQALRACTQHPPMRFGQELGRVVEKVAAGSVDAVRAERVFVAFAQSLESVAPGDWPSLLMGFGKRSVEILGDAVQRWFSDAEQLVVEDAVPDLFLPKAPQAAGKSANRL